MEQELMKHMRNSQLNGDIEEFNLTFADLSYYNDEEKRSRATSAVIGGFNIFAHFPLFWPQIRNFPVEEGDVFIASYPKSGTTWMQHLTYLVMTQDFDGANSIPVDIRAPFIEFPRPPTHDTLDELAKRPKPRLLKTHLPVNLLPLKTCNGKVIYVYRNAKDIAVSYYHHYKSFKRGAQPYDKTFEQFARDFIKGEVSYAPYHKHLIGYYEQQKKCDWILMLRYEDIKSDTRAAIRKVADFLGVTLTDEVVEKIYEATTVESMQQNDATNHSWLEKKGLWQGTPFVRRGVVGDWMNFFTDPQLLMEFDRYIDENLPPELVYNFTHFLPFPTPVVTPPQ